MIWYHLGQEMQMLLYWFPSYTMVLTKSKFQMKKELLTRIILPKQQKFRDCICVSGVLQLLLVNWPTKLIAFLFIKIFLYHHWWINISQMSYRSKLKLYGKKELLNLPVTPQSICYMPTFLWYFGRYHRDTVAFNVWIMLFHFTYTDLAI